MLWACILLPRLALDAVLRRSPDPDAPLALVTGPAQLRHLHAVNETAAQAGLRAGMRLTAAHALLPDFAMVEHDPRADRDRPAVVPENAVWVPGYECFVVATMDGDGNIVGAVDAWRNPHGYTFVKRRQLAYERGRCVRSVDEGRDGSVERVYASDGTIQLEEVVGQGRQDDRERRHLQHHRRRPGRRGRIRRGCWRGAGLGRGGTPRR